jgi:uncharacterized protein (TIGR03382 family)
MVRRLVQPMVIFLPVALLVWWLARRRAQK